jgi:hypothetical protein
VFPPTIDVVVQKLELELDVLLDRMPSRMAPITPRITRTQTTAKTIQPILVSRRDPWGSVELLVRATMPSTSETTVRKLQRLRAERIVSTRAEVFVGVGGPVV